MANMSEPFLATRIASPNACPRSIPPSETALTSQPFSKSGPSRSCDASAIEILLLHQIEIAAQLHGARSHLRKVVTRRSGLRMFVRQPQQRESDKRHYYVDWQNQSHVSWREIMRRDHLVNVAGGGAQ